MKWYLTVVLISTAIFEDVLFVGEPQWWLGTSFTYPGNSSLIILRASPSTPGLREPYCPESFMPGEGSQFDAGFDGHPKQPCSHLVRAVVPLASLGPPATLKVPWIPRVHGRGSGLDVTLVGSKRTG